jgi:hypothetical protein
MAITLKPENVAQLVFLIRGEKVMLDADLAALYGVPTKALNQAFRRNRNRFPSDFVFQLTKSEYDSIRSQLVTASPPSKRMRSQIVTASRRNISALPYAFTERRTIRGLVRGDPRANQSPGPAGKETDRIPP